MILYCFPNDLATVTIITYTKRWQDDSRRNTNILYYIFIETYKANQISPNLLELKTNWSKQLASPSKFGDLKIHYKSMKQDWKLLQPRYDKYKTINFM